MRSITHQPRAQLASNTTRHSQPVHDEIARLKAEHNISETTAYAMLVRATVAAPTERPTPANPATDS